MASYGKRAEAASGGQHDVGKGVEHRVALMANQGVVVKVADSVQRVTADKATVGLAAMQSNFSPSNAQYIWKRSS